MRFFKTPLLVKSLFPSFVWNIKGEEKIVYPTFDDGPLPELTDYILWELGRVNAKGTFFCVGDNIKKYPDIARRIVNEGHVIGNHTFHHLNGWNTPTEEYIDNAEKFEEIYRANVGENVPKLFRPPYGKITRKQSSILQKWGYKIIMWDVLSYDFDSRLNLEQALEAITSKTKSGTIILFHDNYKAKNNMQYLLPLYLDWFGKKGFQFKSIPD